MNTGLTCALVSAPLRSRAVRTGINGTVILTPFNGGAITVENLGGETKTRAGGTGARVPSWPRGHGAVDLQMIKSDPAMIASGFGSVICGGQDNKASGDASVVTGGENNVSSGSYTTSGGINCIASGAYCVAFGHTCTASGPNAATALGRSNTASADYGIALGYGALANRSGQMALANGFFAAIGDAQSGQLVLRYSTSSTAQQEMSFDGSAASGNVVTTANRFIVEANTAVYVDAQFAWRDSSGNSGAAHRRCLIKRNGADATTLVGTQQTIGTDVTAEGAPAFDLVADDGLEALKVLVTPAAATATRFICVLRFRIITY